MAAQLTFTNGMSCCALRKWIARATSSLPVPVSPVMSTVLFDWAMRSAWSTTARIGRLVPTIP